MAKGGGRWSGTTAPREVEAGRSNTEGVGRLEEEGSKRGRREREAVWGSGAEGGGQLGWRRQGRAVVGAEEEVQGGRRRFAAARVGGRPPRVARV